MGKNIINQLRKGDISSTQLLQILEEKNTAKQNNVCFYTIGSRESSVECLEHHKKKILFMSKGDVPLLRLKDELAVFTNPVIVNSMNYSDSTNNHIEMPEAEEDVLVLYVKCPEKEWSHTRLEWMKQTAFLITKAVNEICNKKNIPMLFVSEEQTKISAHAFLGLFQTLKLENPAFQFKILRVQSESARKNAEHIVCELDNFKDALVYYDSGVRKTAYWKEEREKGDLYENSTDFGSVVLITGGLGSLAQKLAKYLLRMGVQKIYLTGRIKEQEGTRIIRNAFPEEENQISYIMLDVMERFSCEQAVSRVLKKEGKIDGIIHLAGILRDGYANRLTYQDFDECIGTKCNGILNLNESFSKYSVILKYIKVYSSITSYLGNVGQAAYAVANGILNAMAEDSKNSAAPMQALLWPLWKDGGMQADSYKINKLFQKTGQKYLYDQEGEQALSTLWNMNGKSILILSGEKSKLKHYLEDSLLSKETTDSEVEINAKSISLEEVISYIRTLIAGIMDMQVLRLDIRKNWDQYGIDSLGIMKVNDSLEEIIPNVSKTIMYECQNVKSLSEYLFEKYKDILSKKIRRKTEKLQPKQQVLEETVERKAKTFRENEITLSKKENLIAKLKQENQTDKRTQEIAIIGMAGRYPMAENLDEFWNNMLDGKDCIEEIPSDRWDYSEDYNSDKSKKGYSHSKWGGFIKDYNCFDAKFFHMTPREARYIDPQERIFLECSYHALEDACYSKKELENERVGVFTGVMYSHYQLYGTEYKTPGKKKAYNSSYASIANRVSYYFNFKGPSMAVDTMCSSSLTALHLARQSILNGECTMAVCGGVNLSLHPNKYVNLCQSNFLSSDGRCRSFGDGGDGYVPAEGVGAVILKELSQAKKDGDHIYGTIVTTALNHGGRANGFTVPNPMAQSEVIEHAMKSAGVKAEDYDYIEAHGTGTPLGDPIELNALAKVFGKLPEKCPVGSVKSNIGHGEAVSGMAGLMKILLQMKYQTLVPSIHSKTLNKNISFDELPFYIQREALPWNRRQENGRIKPHVAGLSSFGAGGSNAHVIVKEYMQNNATEKNIADKKINKPQLIVISAKDEKDLQKICTRYIEFLKNCIDKKDLMEISLEHFAFSVQNHKNLLAQKLAFVADDITDVIKTIDGFLNGEQELPCKVFKTEEEIKEQSIFSLNESHRKEELTEIAKECVQCDTYDFTVLWNGKTYPKTWLPLYPFEKTVYWIDKIEPDDRLSAGIQQKERITNLSNLFEFKYETIYHKGDTFIKDHVIQTNTILPGAALIENARILTIQMTNNGAYKLKNLTFLKPVKFVKDTEMLTSIVKNMHLEMYMTVDKQLKKCSVADITPLESLKNVPVNKEDLLSRCNAYYDGEKLYCNFQKQEQYYGADLQMVEDVHYSDSEAIVQFKRNMKLSEEQSLRNIPFIDGAFQGVYVFKNSLGLKSGETMLPYKVKEILWDYSVENIDYIYIRKMNDETFDLYVMNIENQPCLELLGFSVSRIRKEESKDSELSQILSAIEDGEINVDDAVSLFERWMDDDK